MFTHTQIDKSYHCHCNIELSENNLNCRYTKQQQVIVIGNMTIDVTWKHINVCFSQITSACASITEWYTVVVVDVNFDNVSMKQIHDSMDVAIFSCILVSIIAFELWLQSCIFDLEVHLILSYYCIRQCFCCVATTMTDQLGIVKEKLVTRLGCSNKYAPSTPIRIVTQEIKTNRYFRCFQLQLRMCVYASFFWSEIFQVFFLSSRRTIVVCFEHQYEVASCSSTFQTTQKKFWVRWAA